MGSAFRDEAVQPTDDLISEVLGDHAAAWPATCALFAEAQVPVAWRFYRDGGWLAKAALGRRTIAWLAVADGSITVTFYFAERHRVVLLEAPGIDPATRERIASAPLMGKLLPVSFAVRQLADTESVRAVLAVKLTAR